ncbi:MAG TPA: TadE/TadG family type IV pilus assembly protein [Candidatus Limnocylindrales bacterium]|nr:TadE/TadG family type IV pilus assembly protein [Candidatus Limnocylindrales bacterium]
MGRRSQHRHNSRGQSLVEFAVVLPVVLLVILIALDFGRVFLAWVEVNNAVREAANFAAQNPNPNANGQAQYQQLIANEWANIDCTVPSPAPTPTFPAGTSVGQPAEVSITCQFHPITPVIGAILGGSVAVGGFAAFPIRAGAIAGIPVQTGPVPTPTSPPSSSPTPSTSPSPTVSPTPSPTPMCTVPDFVGTATNKAQNTWTKAGFSLSVVFDPLIPPQYGITSQSQTPGASLPCDSTGITVSSK